MVSLSRTVRAVYIVRSPDESLCGMGSGVASLAVQGLLKGGFAREREHAGVRDGDELHLFSGPSRDDVSEPRDRREGDDMVHVRARGPGQVDRVGYAVVGDQPTHRGDSLTFPMVGVAKAADLLRGRPLGPLERMCDCAESGLSGSRIRPGRAPERMYRW